MKRRLPVIREDLEFITVRYKAEKHARKKERLLMLYLLKSHQAKTMKDVAALLAVDRNTVGHWLTRYEQEGLEGLLDLRTKPNRPLSLSQDILALLREKLHNPRTGFRSYKEIVCWLQQEFRLKLPYKTVHNIVRYKLQAKLKVPRKSHKKKDDKATQEYKSNFTETIQHIVSLQASAAVTLPTHLVYEDESRFGLQTVQRRCITLKGVKPVGTVQHDFDNYYLYGVVEPTTGEVFFLELPALDSDCFQVFLEQFSMQYTDGLYIMLLDRGKFHRAQALRIPENIILEFLPAYSPELNPIERLWQDIKDRIANEVFDALRSLKDRVANILKEYSLDCIKSITGYAYILDAVNAVLQ